MKYSNYTFIAHNASVFDSYIMLDYFRKQVSVPNITMRGIRVLLMYDEAYKQRWIDS